MTTSTSQRGTRQKIDAAQLVRGVSPVLAVAFTEDGDIDIEGFRRVVRYVLGTGVGSMMFPGFASEFHKLSDAERWELSLVLFELTRDRDDVAAILALQHHSTLLAQRHARALIDAGADVLNVLPPHFLGPSREAVQAHVRAVLSAAAPTPVVLQYAPTETGTSLDAGTLAGIARDHANLRLVKVESSPPGRLIAELAAMNPPLPAVEGYAGVQLPDAFRRGAVGTQPGCSFIELYVEIWRRLSTGDESGGYEVHRQLLPYISYWMADTELIISAEKLICQRRGLIDSAYCRAPGHTLDTEEVAVIDRFLAEFVDLLPNIG